MFQTGGPYQTASVLAVIAEQPSCAPWTSVFISLGALIHRCYMDLEILLKAVLFEQEIKADPLMETVPIPA